MPDTEAARFVGVGLGPGDPELVTVKAVRVLSRADVILVPQTERAGADLGRAERLVRDLRPDAAGVLERVDFAMRQSPAGAVEPADSRTRQSARDQAAARVAARFDTGARLIAMATIGDPSVFSTFSYLAEAVRRDRPAVRVEVVPGITAMQALAAAAGVPLVIGDETLTLVPATAGTAALERALALPDCSVVAYKGGRQLPMMRDLLARYGRLPGALLGTDIGGADQRLSALADLDPDAKAPYFTTLLSPAVSR
ncbi:MAG: precorrin-2 C(20)-methyltransferase [Austwickia sp.]|nr:precorrin-2 C(20)-methyltransferase [Austwickia sp.]MBK8437846.1 precorrin-2 C(20)-methyltransferase [Austwickia sp.]MBK9100153.1 precorrin-2 C(20)-methyltransferase [Austwickia sp.]